MLSDLGADVLKVESFVETGLGKIVQLFKGGTKAKEEQYLT